MNHTLNEIASLFLKLGATAFGGPAAHIAMMEDEVVTRRGWITRQQFVDLIAAANLIPGPNSTELAIHIGHLRGGVRGLLVAGICFILPAFLITMACGWAYVQYGSTPAFSGAFGGMKPVVVAIVLLALWRLRETVTHSKIMVATAILCFIAALFKWDELLILAGGALMTAAAFTLRRFGRDRSKMLAVVPFTLMGLFLFFAKVGAVLYGSGYVLLAFIENGLVREYGWITQQQLLDAVAVGQVTPGPVFSTATFIGYLLGGPVGATVATVGIFLPAFAFVAITAPIIPRLRKSAFFSALLDGLNAASIALMAVVTYQLAIGTLTSPLAIVLAFASLTVMFWSKINPTVLLAVGAIVGCALG